MRAGLTILLAGMLAGDPRQGGATWAVLQYVLGLRRLGHDVHVVEPVPELRPDVVAYFGDVARAFDLEDRMTLLERGTRRSTGAPLARLETAARGADLLLNVSGMLDDPALTEPVDTRVFLDLDPAFIQLWHAAEGVDMGFDRHERFVTVGLCLGDTDCPVPTCGRDWIRTPQPVVLDAWPPVSGDGGSVTTIGNFRGYGSIEWEGRLYGQKVHSLRELYELPERTAEPLELAMHVHPDERADREALARHGWRLADPVAVAGDPHAYASYVRASKAEIGIAKSGYVHSRCGWFSDRSACYLASGRPVVAQDTGFGRRLPVGEGLLAFTDVDSAAAALDEVAAHHARHAAAARRLAEDVFESDRVLGDLIEALA